MHVMLYAFEVWSSFYVRSYCNAFEVKDLISARRPHYL